VVPVFPEVEVVVEFVVVELLETERIPPTAPPGGEVLVVAFLARAVNAARVFPVVGALIAATMPD